MRSRSHRARVRRTTTGCAPSASCAEVHSSFPVAKQRTLLRSRLQFARMLDSDPIDLNSVALFPLPGVVLFPRAVLPLHIFEDRYRAMTADALRGDKLIAMALLKPGWEKSYYGRPAIEETVCVGRIISHEKLADGKYNFLLQGVTPARVHRENQVQPYRRAELKPVVCTEVSEADLEHQRRRLIDLFLATPL